MSTERNANRSRRGGTIRHEGLKILQETILSFFVMH